MADIEILRHLAAKTGLGLKYLSKDEKISVALEQLRPLFPEAILKGGTALNRVHLAKKGVSRFSEDIDLDFISAELVDKKISAIKERIAKMEGFDVQGPRILHSVFRFDCYYVGELGEKDRVMIEFNVRERKFLGSGDVLVKSPFIETHPAIFRVYSLEDLIAGKLAALNSRTEGKDIYDLFYALDLDFDKKKLAAALSYAYPGKEGFREFFKSIGKKLKGAKENAHYIGNSANHFIPTTLRPEWKMFIGTLAQKIRGLAEAMKGA